MTAAGWYVYRQEGVTEHAGVLWIEVDRPVASAQESAVVLDFMAILEENQTASPPTFDSCGDAPDDSGTSAENHDTVRAEFILTNSSSCTKTFIGLLESRYPIACTVGSAREWQMQLIMSNILSHSRQWQNYMQYCNESMKASRFS